MKLQIQFISICTALLCVSGVKFNVWDDIRLVGANSHYKGRVEVRRDGVWGTVCSDRWSLYDAHVACKQLGFDGAAIARTGAFYGAGTGPIHHDDLNCKNIENTLDECPGRHGSSDCTHEEDAGVDCIKPSPQAKLPTCRPNQFLCQHFNMCIPARWSCDGDNDCGNNADEADNLCHAPINTGNNSNSLVMDDDSGGDGQSRVQVVLKLEGGKLPNEGRVEVFYNGEWGTICDDNFGMTEADIICRELGFRGAAGTRANGYYGQGSGRIWIDELKCTGNEYNIMECTRNPWGTNDCSHAEDVGVICQTKNLIVAPVANVVTTTTLAPKVCGVPLFRANMGRIVGGSLAAKGSWPWQGSLRLLYSNGGSAHTCGATLVAPNWAVTAAHCFGQSRDPNGYKIRFGEHDQRYWERTEEDRRVSKLVMHSQYNVRPHANDIAMLKLDTPVNMASPYVNTACLPDANEVFDSHDTCFVTGWGSTQGTSYGFLLNQVNVPIISNFDCWRSYGSTILDSMLCAGYVQGGKDACQGDSGGPFVCIKNGRWKLAGIVSWGRDCGAVYSPGVYTRVSKYLNWINYIIQNE